MRTHKHRTRALAAMIAAFGALAMAGSTPAHADGVPVSGTQTVVDENAGTFKMHGSLVGDWRVTTFDVLDTSPLMHAKGTERFSGCLDRGRDGSCQGDPAGTLRFTIDYHALFDPAGSQNLVWGACYHPVTGGTGGFAGARGVIVMADTPTASGVSTSYVGNLTLADAKTRGRARQARASAASAPRGCGR
jgi:hypothetical protein